MIADLLWTVYASGFVLTLGYLLIVRPVVGRSGWVLLSSVLSAMLWPVLMFVYVRLLRKDG